MVKFVPWRSTEGPLHTVFGDRGLDHAYVKPKRSLDEEPEPYSAVLEVLEALPFLGSQRRVFDTVVDAKSLGSLARQALLCQDLSAPYLRRLLAAPNIMSALIINCI